ncbi:hypothetical protein J437_LFUL002255 [Ladona fulva]|uniref:Fork-head domain-containing protein n=1 Tax=Ladona fulva TaxID=123851 RepID=A0A8K0NYS9_LADFU|nr:hypothetical protein J437_LFUL002255 [Ladona fulva]
MNRSYAIYIGDPSRYFCETIFNATMIGPSLGQEENGSENSKLYDEYRINSEEEISEENIVILDANNSISFSDLGRGNRPARLEVVIVQGTWNESDENSSLTLSSDIFADLETEESNNDRNTTNIISEIIDNENGQNRIYYLDKERSEEAENDSHCENSCGIEKEENNLLWLLNYKLDAMLNVDDVDHDHSYLGKDYDPNEKFSCFKGTIRESSHNSEGGLGARFYAGEQYKGRRVPNIANQYRRSLPNFSTSCVLNSPVLTSNMHSKSQGCNSVLRKPPFTYTEMIEQALSESGELTVSGIYNWISKHFPFYKANDDRWKNSVRHNLSINPHFKKGCKARHGAGHLWTIATQEDRPRTASRKRRLEQFWAQNSYVEQPSTGRTSPTTLAVQSITLPENTSDMSCMGLGNRYEQSMISDIKTEVMPQDPLEDNKENSDKGSYVPQVFCPVLYNGPKPHLVSLEQTAEEILSGVKREVEVQYLTPMQQKRFSSSLNNSISINPKDSGHILFPADFLNPVSKTEVVQESGLFLLDDGVTSYIVADENFPVGADAEHGEVIVSDNLFGEDLNFHYQDMVSPQTAQQLHV